MKTIFLCLLTLFSFGCTCARIRKAKLPTLEIQAQDKQAHKMKLLVGVIGDDTTLMGIAQTIAQDIALAREEYTGFAVTIKKLAQEPRSTHDIKRLFHDGFSLALFVSKKDTGMTYRLYDATQAKMVNGKRVVMSGMHADRVGHHVASLVMEQLMGRPVDFSASLAYCTLAPSGKQHKHIYVTDPHAPERKKTVLQTASPKCGLCWHAQDAHTQLYFSEQSPVNVRLMSYDMEQKCTKLVMNFDGLNMQPSFSEDGNTVVVCLSQAGSSQLYKGVRDSALKQWSFKRLTHNRGNNISPHLMKNGDIIFCSDYQTRRPQLYCYHTDGTIERLTDGGYCACPAVHEALGKIACIKLINGYSQLCEFDITSKTCKQLTFDQSHKDEPTWSPCGAYVAYTVEQGESSRIAVRNMVSQEQYFVTSANEHCSNPAWGIAC